MRRRWSWRLARVLLATTFVVGGGVVTVLAATGDAGHVGPSYEGAVSAPSGEKPEHKLWFHDGTWWGHLFHAASGDYHIFRLDASTATWVDTGVTTDTRGGTKADVLWDGNRLLIASHQWTSNGGAATNGTILYRLHYDTASRRFLHDAGFPVKLSDFKSETISIDRDGAGRLWATWAASGRIWVAATNGSDASWGAPFHLPVPHNVSSDDISALIAFNGSIGVMWSDQPNGLFGFGIHSDASAPTAGWTAEIAHQAASGSDDHINLKVDAAGNVYAAVKTEQTASVATLTAVLRRAPSGMWTYHPVSTVAEGHTRPILVLNEQAGILSVYSTTPESGGTIVERSATLATLSFASSSTQVVIRQADDLTSNNASSTRDSVSASTGVVVLGSTANVSGSRRYVFSMSGVPSGPAPSPSASASPTATPSQAPSPTPSGSPSATPSPTTSPSPMPGSVTIAPSADAYVYSNNATRNFGTEAALRVREGSTSSPHTWRTYLSFDLSGIASPTQATLRMWVTDKSSDGGSVWRVSPNYEATTTPWTESGITWANAPAIIGSPVAAAQRAVDGTWIEWDVSAALDGSSRLDLALQSGSSDSVLYSSREGSSAPQLVVSGGSVGPTPSASSSPTMSPSPEPTPVPTPTPTPDPTPTSSSSPSASPSHTPSPSPTPLPSSTPPGGGDPMTLEPVADVFVYSGNTTRNYGTDAALRVREGTTASPYSWYTYLSFDIGDVGSPIQATLRLWVTDKSADSGAVWSVASTYVGTSTPWTESALTWANAPTISGEPIADRKSAAAGTWVEFDVSNALGGATNRLDLALRSLSTDSAIYSSREGAVPPQLVLVPGG